MASKENKNVALWDSVCETDPANTKNVNDGRRNFTCVCAYSQIRRATELWGPYGTTWKLEDLNIQFGPGPQLVTLTGRFVYPDGDFPVMNMAKHTNNKGAPDQDCLKKLGTDTLTKALSKLGFNADIFLGKFDDLRYVDERRRASDPNTQAARNEAEELISNHRALIDGNADVAAWVGDAMKAGAYDDVIGYLRQYQAPPEPEADPANPNGNPEHVAACELLVAKQGVLTPKQQAWAEGQIAAGNYQLVTQHLQGL
jgi:hypothetical protein